MNFLNLKHLIIYNDAQSFRKMVYLQYGQKINWSYREKVLDRHGWTIKPAERFTFWTVYMMKSTWIYGIQLLDWK